MVLRVDVIRRHVSVEDAEDGHVPVTHRLAAHLGVDAQQVQVMKASFFADEDDDHAGGWNGN